MKHVVRALGALAMLAVATPALPCSGMNTTAERPAAQGTKQTVAKADAKKADAKAKAAQQKATAAN